MSEFRGYLTLRQLAEYLGYEYSKRVRMQLWRALNKRQNEVGVQLLLRPDGERAYKVTIPLLRDHMPEWFNRRDRAAEKLGKRFDRHDVKMAVLSGKYNALAARLRQLEQWRREIESLVAQVTASHGS